MPEIVIMGELLVEIMRPTKDIELFETGDFRGPFPSGAPGIFISTAARLGHSTGIIGGVGEDDFGKVIYDRLEKDGVNLTHLIRSKKGPTGTAHVTYFSNGDRKFIFHVDGTPAIEAKMPKDLSSFGDVKYFHVMGCSLMASVQFGREIVKTMRAFIKKGAKISFDPNVRLEMLRDPEALKLVQEVYRNTNIFMPGVSELLMIAKADPGAEEVHIAVRENKKLELLVLKNGSKGSTVYNSDGFVLEQGIYPGEPVDATGAGDSFDAAFICGLAEGRTTLEAAKMATAAATLNVIAFGPMEGKINRENVFSMMETYD